MKEETKLRAREWAILHLENKREACGLVIVESGKEVFIPCKNISELDDAFIIDPVDYYKAESRGEIVRVFHSHLHSSPRPSEPDLVSCEASGLPWSIISVPNGDWFHFEPSNYKAPLVNRSWSHGILDCYSLIKDYYQEILQIELPDFDRTFEWWLKGENLYAENFEKAGFFQVPSEEMREHDVVLMQVLSPVINHGAVYISNDKILHHLHRRLSSRDVYGGYWKKHTVKILRHKSCVQ